jgi:hypothetical protein
MANAFIGRARVPTEADVTAVLGRKSHALWTLLSTEVKRDLGINREEWKSYSKKAGWSLRLGRKTRNLVYLVPETGKFSAALVLGQKAVMAAREARLPSCVRDAIANAKRYPEGSAVRIAVRNRRDVEAVETLARIKLEN